MDGDGTGPAPLCRMRRPELLELELDPWCDGVRLGDSCFFGLSDFARKERDIRFPSVCLSVCLGTGETRPGVSPTLETEKYRAVSCQSISRLSCSQPAGLSVLSHGEGRNVSLSGRLEMTQGTLHYPDTFHRIATV